MIHLKENSIVLFLTLLLAFFISSTYVTAESMGDSLAKPVAEENIGANGIGWTPKVSYHHMVLTVSCPDGTVFGKTFDNGTTLYMGLSDNNGKYLVDGSYTYELLAAPELNNRRRGNDTDKGLAKSKPLIQTGYFSVKNGSIVTASTSEQGLSRPMDEVIYDDLIVDGSLCVGNDCYSGLAFGFDTIVLMENNLRIYFDDTSNTSSFPNNDWRIVINDTTDGGGKYFAIQDVSGGLTPFTIEAGAKSNSIYVDDDGQVGIGTSGPVFELHIKEGDTPTVRLHQSTAYGWPEQIWDVGGNETSFFIRDGSHGAVLPFRIEPETPSSTLCLKSDGKVGVGTWSPAYPLEVETTGTAATLVCQQTDGATAMISGGGSYVFIGAKSNNDFRLLANDTPIMTLEPGGDVGIGLTNPTYKLHITGGAYCDGGAWMPGSSREYKENIIDLTLAEATNALMELNPVKFNYKESNTKEDYIGFIAEDVPQLVATKERKSVSPMDVVAVLTKVVQEQQRLVKEQQQIVKKQQKTIDELKEKIDKLLKQ